MHFDIVLKRQSVNSDVTQTTQLQARLRNLRGTRVSRQIIRKWLPLFLLNTRRPFQVTLLTPRHPRVLSLVTCSEHKNMWTWKYSTGLPSWSLVGVMAPCKKMMVVRIAEKGKVSNTSRSTCSPVWIGQPLNSKQICLL